METYRDEEISRLRKELNKLLDQKRWEECPHDEKIVTYMRYQHHDSEFVTAIRGDRDSWDDRPVCYRQCTKCGFEF